MMRSMPPWPPSPSGVATRTRIMLAADSPKAGRRRRGGGFCMARSYAVSSGSTEWSQASTSRTRAWPICAMAAPAVRSVQQAGDRGGQGEFAIGLGVDAGVRGGDAGLVQVIRDDRQAEIHVFDDLVHRALVRPRVLWVGIDAERRGGQDAAKLVVADPAGEGGIVHDALRLGVGLDRGLVRAAADEQELEIVAAELLAQVLGSADQMVDAVLLADLAEINQQMRLAGAVGRVRRIDGGNGSGRDRSGRR